MDRMQATLAGCCVKQGMHCWQLRACSAVVAGILAVTAPAESRCAGAMGELQGCMQQTQAQGAGAKRAWSLLTCSAQVAHAGEEEQVRPAR